MNRTNKYLDLLTFSYPRMEWDIKAENRNTIFPIPFEPTDRYVEVKSSPLPTYNPLTHKVVETFPRLADGNYYEVWVLQALAEGEVAMMIDTLRREYDQKLGAYMDRVAGQRSYESRITAAVRAGYPGPFQAEGIAFASWMDHCNAACYQIMADVISGKRPLMTFEALVAELPAMVWPA